MTVEVGLIVGKVSAFDMDALDSRIRELVAFARERDGEDRTTLFRSLVDMFLTGKAPVREPTRGQLLDVIEALIPHVEPESRRTVAEILSNMSKPPMDLVRRLSRDRAKLVEDLLTNAPLDEEDIIDLIGSTGREHHQILAARSDLSANVWIALARAAPSAPPFEGQSTLALWRDDLGAHDDQETVGQDTVEVEEYVAPRKVAGGGGGATMMAPSNLEQPFAATVTRLHPETLGTASGSESKKPASLRILKTDEDLIAERMTERPSMPETKMVQGNMDDSDACHTLTTPQPDEKTGVDARAAETTDEAPRFLRDPGPGGWAWRSDRDGFITVVSPYAAKLFGSLDSLKGVAMLDMLGLNTKLDHPVSRAFQRRSTIHDAPITLPTLDTGHLYWTLEAAPVFSASGGVFEGFEGILTPVVPAKESLEAEEDEYDQPLFLDDDVKQNAKAPSKRNPASFTDTASVMHPADNSGLQMASAPSASSKEPDPAQTSTKESNPIADMINSTAAAMVREAVADALNPLTPGEEEKRFGPTASDLQNTETTALPLTGDEALSTLAILEEAIERLVSAGEKGASAQVRLQAEIANACLRALKIQLGKPE